MTYLVFGSLPCQIMEQLRPSHHPALLEVRAVLVGEAGGGEDGDLMTACDGVHGVDGGDAGLDHGLRIFAGGGVDGHVVDVEVGLGQEEGV